MKHVGKEIDRILKENKIKHKDVAETLGMSAVNLSKILKKDSIDAELLERISKVLNVSVTTFFDQSINETLAVVTGRKNKYINGDNNFILSDSHIGTQQNCDINTLLNNIRMLESIIVQKDSIIEEKEKHLLDKDKHLEEKERMIKLLFARATKE